jgi:hypothetical protein
VSPAISKLSPLFLEKPEYYTYLIFGKPCITLSHISGTEPFREEPDATKAIRTYHINDD